jgi:hypothetical protein
MSNRFAGVVTALAVVLGGTAPGVDDAAFVSLFDGQSLDGWSLEHTDRFNVRDGVIVNSGGTGWLRYKKPFRDFELQAEYRAMEKGADTGIFFRATAESAPKNPHWPAGGYQLSSSTPGTTSRSSATASHRRSSTAIPAPSGRR